MVSPSSPSPASTPVQAHPATARINGNTSGRNLSIDGDNSPNDHNDDMRSTVSVERTPILASIITPQHHQQQPHQQDHPSVIDTPSIITPQHHQQDHRSSMIDTPSRPS